MSSSILETSSPSPKPAPTKQAVNAELAKRSLAEFVRQAWPIVEPGTTLVWGGHIDHVCAHLEAVTFGEIKRLCVNVPPGHSKSLLTSVFWPAWEWLHKPHLRIISASYAQVLAIRDAVKCRMVLQSDWYQNTFAPEWQFTSDQNAKTFYQNSLLGSRFIMTPESSTTGWRGHQQIWDDLLNVMDGYSDKVRESTNLWMDLAAGNRLNDQRTGAIVMIAQRLHDDDPPGHVLAQGGWEHVCLPSRYEPERKYRTCLADSINPRRREFGTDWRTEPGELLHPEFFPPAVVDAEEKRLGPLGFAGQHQQYPTPAKGNLFLAEYLCPDDSGRHFWPDPIMPIKEAYLSYDTATKEKTMNDYTAGSLDMLCADGYVYEEPLCYERMEIPRVVHRIALDWARCKIKHGEALKGVRIEEGAGTAVVQYLRRLMVQRRDDDSKPPGPEWKQEEWDLVRKAPPVVVLPYSTGIDKVSRAMHVVPFYAGRNVRLLNRSLSEGWLQSYMSFPLAAHDDAVDAGVGGVEPFAGIVDVGQKVVDDDNWWAKVQGG